MNYKIVSSHGIEWLSNNWLPQVSFDHVHAIYTKLLSDKPPENRSRPMEHTLEDASALADTYMTFMPFLQKIPLYKDNHNLHTWYMEIPAHQCRHRLMSLAVKNRYSLTISHMALYIQDGKTKRLVSSQKNNINLVLHPAGLPTIALWNATLVLEVTFDPVMKDELFDWVEGWPMVEMGLCVFPRQAEQYTADRTFAHGPYPVIHDGIPTHDALSFRDGHAHHYKPTFFQSFDAFKHPLRYA